MKKMLITLMGVMFAGFSLCAAPRPIHVVKKPADGKGKEGRSLVLLPTASIDGQVLTIEFSEATASQITVISQGTQVVVYNGSFTNNQIVVNLPALSDGEYQLEIEQGGNLYIGDFEI